MGDSLTKALPWWPSRRKSKTAETTSGHSESTPWGVVAINLGPAEAAIVKGLLDSEQIPAIIQQEAMGVVLGLTVGPMGSARILVPEPFVEKALELLGDTIEACDEEDWEDEA